MPAGDAGYSNPEILIPLESVVVLSTWAQNDHLKFNYSIYII